jgi:PAS domain S-box-containing protein
MSADWAIEQSHARRRLTLKERELAETSERYRSLFVYHPHAAFSLDLEGGFENANPASERLSGFTVDELRQMNFATIVHPGDLTTVLEAFQDVLNRHPRELEARMVHQDGHVIELSLMAVPIVVCDEVVGVHGVAEDVTDRNTMRRELEAARRTAEDASATKSLFLANMSHEVRTPLTSVLAATEMLAELDRDPESSHLLTIIERSGERLLRLVNDLLDFSRLEAGKVELEDDTISVRALAEEAVCWATPMAEQEHLGFVATVDPELPERLRGDALRISQVLTNLITNALKFTERGQVELTVCLVGSTPGTAEVRFLVQDSGIGIPSDALPTLFHSFTQGDPSSTRKYGGAGLGLAICQELVTLMGGSIWAESTVGAGSTFWFTLPLEVVDPA